LLPPQRRAAATAASDDDEIECSPSANPPPPARVLARDSSCARGAADEIECSPSQPGQVFSPSFDDESQISQEQQGAGHAAAEPPAASGEALHLVRRRCSRAKRGQTRPNPTTPWRVNR
jgi:hypothetical protein